jgi:cytochrome c oxidase subunit II
MSMTSNAIVLALLWSACLWLSVPPAAAQERDALVIRGESTFKAQGCYGCHQVGRSGTPIGPDLSHVGGKYPIAYLTGWLRDPESVRPAAHMPKLELGSADVEALAAYLASLQ